MLTSLVVLRTYSGRALLAVVIGFGVVASAISAPGATPAFVRGSRRVALRWTAPAGCPGGADVVAEVDHILETSIARPSHPIRVTAHVRHEGDRYRVRLEIESEEGSSTREIHSSSCKAVADATALVLAIIIDPSARLPGSAARRTSSSTPASKPDLPKLPPRRFRPARPRPARGSPSRSMSFHALAWVGVDQGSLPALSSMFGAGVGVQLGAQRFELGAAFWPERFGGVHGSVSTGGEVSLLAGSIRTCRVLLPGRVELGPCVAVELGRLHARGVGVDRPGEASELWSALAVGGALRWTPLRSLDLGLTVRLGVAFPLLRPRFVLTRVGPVYRPATVASRVALGLDFGL